MSKNKNDISGSKKRLFGSGHSNKNMSAVHAARLELAGRLISICFVLVVACFAVFSYKSRAWFASNKDVNAENASVTSVSGTQNLFIRLQGQNSTDYQSLIQTDWDKMDSRQIGLYPISTADCVNWYYISDWTMVLSDTTKTDSTGITTGEYYASGYAPASISKENSNDGIYTVGKEERRAYYCGRYNLYTDNGALDVYLDPDNPIVISTGNDTNTNMGLLEAIRVGIVVGSTDNQSSTETEELVFIYAPVAESGTGKNFISEGKMADANTFYAVTGVKSATEQKNILVGSDGLAAYKGGAIENDPHSFTAGTTAICRANDTAGANVSVYIWLEGMDAQGVINVADGRTIGVNLKFVGVPVEDASGQENGTGE